MSISAIILNQQFIFSILIHGLLIITGIWLLEYIKLKFEHAFLIFMWDRVTIPLYRAFLIILFVFMSYPIIFGLEEAQTISSLLAQKEGRIDSLINVLFLISLLFPLLPILGKQIELILPLQVIACCIMVFSWLAEANGYHHYSDWPGFSTFTLIIIIAIFSHYLANHLASYLGERLDKRLNIIGCQEIIMGMIILFMQIPAILLYSIALGKQIII